MIQRGSIIAVALGTLALVPFLLLVFGGFYNAWVSLQGIFATGCAYVLAFMLFVMFAIGSCVRPRRGPWIAGLIATSVLFFTGRMIGNSMAGAIRASEVRQAMEAGLERDCRATYAAYRDDPRMRKSGYVFLFPNSTEYASLPTSIRLIRPCYVTIEDDRGGAGAPNVGLCKCGFGGFAEGVRVFLEHDRIPAAYWRQPLSPNTYLWREET
jgi:hypothetical protein